MTRPRIGAFQRNSHPHFPTTYMKPIKIGVASLRAQPPCYGVQYFGLSLTSIYTIKDNFSLGHSQILSIASGWPEIN